MRKLLVAVILLVSLSASTLASVIVDPADYTGSRSTPPLSGVVGYDGWSNDEGGFKVEWTITHELTGLWSYTYTFSDKNALPPPNPDVSHWIMEVSPFITMDNMSNYFTFADPSLVKGAEWWTADPNSPNSTSPGANNGNPNLPADLYGIKFDFTDSTYSFLSSQQPVWGDFYAKDGRHTDMVATVWNTGIGTDPVPGGSFINYIPTPDTLPGVFVPEPGTAVLAIGAVLAGAYARRRRRRAETER